MQDFAQRGTTIVVGTSLDQASVVALRRGVDMAQAFKARIRLVHALPWGNPLLVDESKATSAVIAWAALEAQIIFEPSDVVCAVQAPASALAQVARETKAALVVIGTSRPRTTPGVAGQLAQLLDTLLLVAQPPRRRQELVAATDLRDRRFPVVRAAAMLADACAARLTLVHNFEGASGADRRRVGTAMRDLVALATALPPVKRTHFAVDDSTTDAVSEVARLKAADVVIVGARPGRGHTLNSLLASTGSSVLAIPIQPETG